VPLWVEMATFISIKIEEAYEFGETKSERSRTSDLKHLSMYSYVIRRAEKLTDETSGGMALLDPIVCSKLILVNFLNDYVTIYEAQ
jgi:hypothetical protein